MTKISRFVSPRDFAAAARRDAVAGVAVIADSINRGMPGDGRTITFVLSTSAVARDGDTIATDGWVLENYLKNPVFLWAHADDEPPIGRMTKIWRQGDELRGTVEYADAATYPFADTIYQLTRAGYINAVSVSWLPLEWKFVTDNGRSGIDFKKQELLEVSAVPVPALPSALATARSVGIDTTPLRRWAARQLAARKPIIPRGQVQAIYQNARGTSYSWGADLPTRDFIIGNIAAEQRQRRAEAEALSRKLSGLPSHLAAPIEAGWESRRLDFTTASLWIDEEWRALRFRASYAARFPI